MPIEKLQMRVMAAIKAERALRIQNGELDPIEQRFDRQKLRSYLQVLDAEAAGAPVPDIARALLSRGRAQWGSDREGRGTVRRWLKEAKRIRDRDWLALAASKDPLVDRKLLDGADEFLRSARR